MAESKTKKKFDNLAAALVDFQAEIPTPKKDSSADTGKYGYNYASLDALTPVILPALAARGLAFSAAPHLDEFGNFGLKAELLHESGETRGGFYPLGNPNAPAQAIGSAISYARRYALLSLTGVAPQDEDDDGAKANESATKEPAAPVVTLDSIRAEIGGIISDETNSIEGADVNALLADLSGSDTPRDWKITHYKKALATLKDRVASEKE